MDIIPHDELVEGEQSQHRLLKDIPLLLFDDGSAEIGENEFYVYTAFILRQYFQSVHIESEVLFQQLYQRDIQEDVLIALADDIVIAALAHNIYW